MHDCALPGAGSPTENESRSTIASRARTSRSKIYQSQKIFLRFRTFPLGNVSRCSPVHGFVPGVPGAHSKCRFLEIAGQENSTPEMREEKGLLATCVSAIVELVEGCRRVAAVPEPRSPDQAHGDQRQVAQDKHCTQSVPAQWLSAGHDLAQTAHAEHDRLTSRSDRGSWEET